jgi:hypothetical protein
MSRIFVSTSEVCDKIRTFTSATFFHTLLIQLYSSTMPPSQLKRLKASLREQGVVGPQKSKKQKKQIAQNGGNKDKRVSRTTALAGIREQFNPFEVKVSARGPKFDVTSNKTMGGRVTKSVKNRPGVTKGLGEENVSFTTPQLFHS